jgi:microcystin-dependent protein
MSNPFVAEIRIFSGNFAPKGWAFCNGQLLPISQNTALFSLLGTTYGGDGKSTFALPNLMGSAPLQPGQGPGLSQRDLGEQSGEPNVTLLTTELPSHTHVASAVNALGNSNSPAGAVWAEGGIGRQLDQNYSTAAPNRTMSPGATSIAGGSVPHNNMSPYLGLTFIIALQGVFPPRP